MLSAKIQVLRIRGDPERLSSQFIEFQVHGSMNFFLSWSAPAKSIPRESVGKLRAENAGNNRSSRAWLNFMQLNLHARGAPQYFHRNDQAHGVLTPLQDAFDTQQGPANNSHSVSFTNKRRRLHGNRVIHCATDCRNFVVSNRRRNFSGANDGMNAGRRKQAYLSFHAASNEYVAGENGKCDFFLAVAPLTNFPIRWAKCGETARF